MTLDKFKEWLKNYASIETHYMLSYYNEITKSNSYGIYNYTFICMFNSKLINIECYPKRKKCKIYSKYYINREPIEIPDKFNIENNSITKYMSYYETNGNKIHNCPRNNKLKPNEFVEWTWKPLENKED